MINLTSKQTEVSEKNINEMDQDIPVENSIKDCLVNKLHNQYQQIIFQKFSSRNLKYLSSFRNIKRLGTRLKKNSC